MKAAFVAALIAASILPASGLGAVEQYNRKPVTLGGLFPDSWGQSLSQAKSSALERFPGHRVFCTGVFMQGYRSDSSWLHGNTRYWDKTFCIAVRPGATRGTAFVLDAKRDRITMYRVRGFDLP